MDFVELYDRFARLRLRRHGFRSRHVGTRAGRVHLLDAAGHGPAPTTVVLHGFSAHATQYGALLRRLRRRVRRVVAPDLPGHGFSDVPSAPLCPELLFDSLSAALDGALSSSEGPVVIFGSSLGGALAIRYALSRPERVGALVLCSPAGAPMKEEEARTLRELLRVRRHADALDFVDRLFVRPSPIRHLMATGVRAQLRRPHFQTLLDRIDSQHFLRPADLGALPMPTLVLWGGADRLLPRGCPAFFRAHLPPHARLEEPADFGHCPFLDMPDALVARLDAFFAELPAGAALEPPAPLLEGAMTGA